MMRRVCQWLWYVGLAFTVVAGATPSATDELLRWEQQVSRNDPASGQAYLSLIVHHAFSAPDRAQHYAAQARQYFKQHPDPATEAMVESEAAYALIGAGRYAEAMSQSLRAAEFAREHGQDEALARAVMNRGSVRYVIGDYEGALADYQDAAKRYGALKRPDKVQKVNKNIGNVLMQLGQLPQAEQYYRELLAYATPRPAMAKDKAYAEEGLASALNRQGLTGEAVSYYRAALATLDALGSDDSRHIFLSGLSATLLKRGERQEALQVAEQGLALLHGKELGLFSAALYINKADALQALGKADDALLAAQQALSQAELQKDLKARGDAWRSLAGIYVAQKHSERAFEALRQSVSISEQLASERARSRVQVLNAAYESERAKAEIAVLNARTKAQDAALLAERDRNRLITLLVVLGIGALMFELYRRQQRRNLRQQRRLNTKLIELDKLKDQVLANTSHELRTPLNGIVGLSDLLLMEPLPEPARTHVTMIAESGRRLTRLVDDLLQLSTLKHGSVVLLREPVLLGEVVQQVITLSTPSLIGRPVQLINDIAADLPRVFADRERLLQILHNLIGNALKFTERGSVVVSAEKQDNALRVTVLDTGRGIEAEQMERIFDSFEQGDSRMNRAYQGAGLGLAIARALVRAHGGEIGVQSNPGAGSLFWFTLPVH